MQEILAQELNLEFIGINATKTYQGNDYQVWQLEDLELERLSSIKEEDWKDEWGMWRWTTGSNLGPPEDMLLINGHMICAWEEEEPDWWDRAADGVFLPRTEYNNLLEYYISRFGVSLPKNICALSIDLARYNNINMGELFAKFQGENNVN